MGSQLSFASDIESKGFTEIPLDHSTVNCSHPGMMCWENVEKGMQALCDANGHYIIWKDPEERETAKKMLGEGGYNWSGIRIKQG